MRLQTLAGLDGFFWTAAVALATTGLRGSFQGLCVGLIAFHHLAQQHRGVAPSWKRKAKPDAFGFMGRVEIVKINEVVARRVPESNLPKRERPPASGRRLAIRPLRARTRFPSGRKHLPPKHRPGRHGFPPVETSLFAFHVLRDEDASERPFHHHVAWQDAPKKIVLCTPSQCMVEQSRLPRGQAPACGEKDCVGLACRRREAGGGNGSPRKNARHAHEDGFPIAAKKRCGP